MSDFGDMVDRLYNTVLERKSADPDSSYTAKLMAGGPALLAKKVGEEGVEAALAGAAVNAHALREESADLLYHLCALWAACDVTPQEVADVLRAREGVSGLTEKASRGSSGA